MNDLYIRWCIRRDMPEVVEMDALNFEFPWSEEDFIRCLRQRNSIGLVAEYAGRVVGVVIYELHANRVHILNLSVLPAFHGRGVGRALIEKIESKLNPRRRYKAVVEVRDSNLDAQLFFRKVGFRATGILRDYYTECIDDAYQMELRPR